MSEAPTPHYMGRADVVPGLGPFVPGGEVTWPEVVSSVKPRYTSQAMRARISGTVLLDVVVLEDGRPGEITVVRSLDTRFGLDAAAVTAMRQWRFRPGIRDGVPVQTRIRASMQFSLVE